MSVLLHADSEPIASREEYWRHVVTTTIAPMAMRIGDGPDFRSRIHTGEIGPVQVTELLVPSAELARTAQLVRRSDVDLCKIDVQLTGHMVVEQDGREAPLRPGDFTFVDLSRPCQWTNQPSRVVAVVFPRSLLPVRRDEVGRLTGVRIPGGHGLAQLVSTLAAELVEHIDDPANADRLGTALLDLLSVTLADRLDSTEQVPPESRQRMLQLRIEAFIEERLGDPELSPQLIADAHHISIRYLYRLFELKGETVAAWIRRRRLDQCRRELADPGSRDELIGVIGARWGFPNPDHFSRVFRAVFGVSPRDYRRSSSDFSDAESSAPASDV